MQKSLKSRCYEYVIHGGFLLYFWVGLTHKALIAHKKQVRLLVELYEENNLLLLFSLKFVSID
jgi:hypothetical protein